MSIDNGMNELILNYILCYCSTFWLAMNYIVSIVENTFYIAIKNKRRMVTSVAQSNDCIIYFTLSNIFMSSNELH